MGKTCLNGLSIIIWLVIVFIVLEIQFLRIASFQLSVNIVRRLRTPQSFSFENVIKDFIYIQKLWPFKQHKCLLGDNFIFGLQAIEGTGLNKTCSACPVAGLQN